MWGGWDVREGVKGGGQEERGCGGRGGRIGCEGMWGRGEGVRDG